MSFVPGIDAPFLKIGEGSVGGYSSFKVIGRNGDIDQNQAEQIVGPQMTNFYLPDDAQSLKIASSSADDNPTGPGVGSIFVSYLDENWEAQGQVFALNGQTEVDTGILCRRVNFARSSLSGSGASYNDHVPNGDIDLYHGNTPTGATLQRIPEGIGTTASASYTVPQGKSAQLGALRVQVEGGTNEASFWINIRRNSFTVAPPYNPIVRFPLVSELSGIYEIDFSLAGNVALAERTDVWVTAQAANLNNTIVNANFFLVQSEEN